ncbi:MAG: hypothetical protein MO852_06780 [Candidatus Devosia euplotis]|nr:hypothetical protein [Candidatus Devosia euplotis]
MHIVAELKQGTIIVVAYLLDGALMAIALLYDQPVIAMAILVKASAVEIARLARIGAGIGDAIDQGQCQQTQTEHLLLIRTLRSEAEAELSTGHGGCDQARDADEEGGGGCSEGLLNLAVMAFLPIWL